MISICNIRKVVKVTIFLKLKNFITQENQSIKKYIFY